MFSIDWEKRSFKSDATMQRQFTNKYLDIVDNDQYLIDHSWEKIWFHLLDISHR